MNAIETEFVNLTSHKIVLNSGETYYPSGKVCRLRTEYAETDDFHISKVVDDKVLKLPQPREGKIFIVSRMVAMMIFAFSKGTRADVVYPATSGNEVIRDVKGNIVSVPFLVRFDSEGYEEEIKPSDKFGKISDTLESLEYLLETEDINTVGKVYQSKIKHNLKDILNSITAIKSRIEEELTIFNGDIIKRKATTGLGNKFTYMYPVVHKQ
jgi:hypothetical protein